ncbi:hypothetical protein HFD88_002823 [Aspergillus terreus]|nr:hypothetical protein HFD88_002823 [Aspergillus terreus]
MSSSPSQPQESASKDRKRITDRRAQRNRRERIKLHISRLEKRVEELTDASANGESALLKKLEEKQLENARLADIIKQIHALTGDARDASKASISPAPEVPRGQPQRIRSRTPETQSPDGADIIASTQPTQQLTHEDGTVNANPSPYHELVCGTGFGNYFAVVNSCITGILRTADSITSSAEDDDDLAIRAILHGWESVGHQSGLDSCWEFLRALDQGLFYRTGPVERLAILRLMRAMLAWNAVPPKRSERHVPSYMCPTPTQHLIPHEPLMDFFVWPDLRDHLILAGVSYVPESASAQYASDIRLTWPYQIRDTCKYHTMKEKYQFSNEFNHAYFDLNSWIVRWDAACLLDVQGPF